MFWHDVTASVLGKEGPRPGAVVSPAVGEAEARPAWET